MSMAEEAHGLDFLADAEKQNSRPNAALREWPKSGDDSIRLASDAGLWFAALCCYLSTRLLYCAAGMRPLGCPGQVSRIGFQVAEAFGIRVFDFPKFGHNRVGGFHRVLSKISSGVAIVGTN